MSDQFLALPGWLPLKLTNNINFPKHIRAWLPTGLALGVKKFRDHVESSARGLCLGEVEPGSEMPGRLKIRTQHDRSLLAGWRRAGRFLGHDK